MELVKCPDCKRDISKAAETCPHCGSRLSPFKYFLDGWQKRAALVAAGLLLLWLCLEIPVS